MPVRGRTGPRENPGAAGRDDDRTDGDLTDGKREGDEQEDGEQTDSGRKDSDRKDGDRMNGDRMLAAAVAVLCILSVGAASTSLESTISSDPADVVDPTYEGLPFDDEDVASLIEEVQSAEEGRREATSKPAQEGKLEQRSSGDREQDELGRDGRDQGDSSGSESNEAQDDESTTGGGTHPEERSLLDRLLALLSALWPVLVALLLLGLAYRYRDRLRALLALALGELAPGSGAGVATESDPWANVHPENEVERAWLSMVRAAGLARPWSKTPGECALAAVSSGMDPDAVETITRAFEEVRYGGAPVTDGRERRARQGLRKLDGGRGAL